MEKVKAECRTLKSMIKRWLSWQEEGWGLWPLELGGEGVRL